MIIIGAGLSGLLAGALDRRATILELQKSLPHNHAAVLRFREDKIGKALNIPFRKVRVLKSLWEDGRTVTLTPRVVNQYSRKVTGAIVDRSILSLEPATRFIAPQDLIQQLAEMCFGRIEYGRDVARNFDKLPRPLISTIPLAHMLNFCNMDWGSDDKFQSQPIRVVKYRVRGADVFQTIYYPDPAQAVYRASMTGDELIIESATATKLEAEHLDDVLDSFGLVSLDIEPLTTTRQRFGKILPLPDTERKALLLRLSQEHGIYSLGRFACWRNILLDDVHDDYFRIRRMIELGAYDHIKGVAS